MRAIIIIVLLVSAMAFVSYRVYVMLSSASQAAKAHDMSIQLPDKPNTEKVVNHAQPPVFYNLKQVIADPLLQRTQYEESTGTLSGIAHMGGVYTAFTTDGRVISHTQITAVGRDWVLLKTGALLRYPPPRDRTPKIEEKVSVEQSKI